MESLSLDTIHWLIECCSLHCSMVKCKAMCKVPKFTTKFTTEYLETMRLAICISNRDASVDFSLQW